VNQAVTTTTLLSSLNSPTYGQSVTLTATVSLSPAGNVTFKDGAAVLAVVTLSGGVATLISTQLPVGPHSLTASFGGSTNDAPSTSPALSLPVIQGATTTTLLSSSSVSTYGQSVTLTATVSPASSSGTVSFKDGSNILGTPALSAGTAAISLTTLTVGAHLLTAFYNGDANDSSSASITVPETVNAIVTTTVLTSSPNPATYGQTPTVTAVVSPSTATGSITLSDGSAALTTAPMTNGVAVFTPAGLASGLHALTASYSGDATDASSTGALNLQVQGCGTVTVPSLFVDSVGGPQTITITSSAPSCAWDASTSSSWIQLTPSSGTGSGALIATISPNDPGVVRAGVIVVGGQSIAVTQKITAQAFVDVPASAYYFDSVNQLLAKGITTGCSSGPPAFCPELNIPRWEMAIFVVRSVFGGDNFTASPIPYFHDVASGDPGFAWIQKMYELGITAGCGNGDFCPSEDTPRDQMAVFVIRTRYGATAIFDYPPTPYFNDVTPDTFGWSWIQRMREDNITSGCAPTLFCPENLVTRGEMAVFVMTAGFNDGIPANTPVISTINPATILHGTSGTYTITGVNTNFVQGTYLSIMPGITIGTTTVNSSTSLTVQLTAADDAQLQPVSLLVITGAPPGNEEAVLPNGLVIQ
jgi:Bacterial Ig-like domain (group 3)/S-layer homology domain